MDENAVLPGRPHRYRICGCLRCDQEGLLNTDEPLKVAVSVEGPGEIIGYGSAAPVSEENFYDTEAMTYEGRIRAGVRATGEGVITVTFMAGDKTCSVKIKAE